MNRRQTPSLPKWVIPVAAALVGMLVLGGTTWLALIYFDKPTQTGRDTALAEDQAASEQEMAPSAQLSGGTGSSGQSEMVRIGTYPPGPRLPYTREFLERDFIATFPDPIDQYVYIVPPEENAAPDYIAALARLEESLVEYLPAEEQAEARDLARQRTNLLGELTRKHQQNEAIAQRDVGEFDEIFNDLDEAQQKPEFSLLAVPDLDSRAPLTESIRQLEKLSVIRVADFVERGDLDSAVREIRILSRIGKEIGRELSVGAILGANLRRSLWSTALPLVLKSPDVRPRHTKALLESTTHPSYDAVVRALRSEQVWVFRFFYHLQQSNPAERKKYAEQIAWMQDLIVNGDEDPPEDTNQVKLLHGLFAEIDDSQIALNRDVYVDHLESWIDELDGSVFSIAKRLPDLKRQQQEKLDRYEKSVLEALAKGDVHSAPWLAPLLIPSPDVLITQETMLIALERVAAAQTALKHAELTGNPVGGDLSPLQVIVPSQLNLTDPYSGKPLKVATIDQQTVVYSVGPDRTDDHISQIAERPSQSGDIVVMKNR